MRAGRPVAGAVAAGTSSTAWCLAACRGSCSRRSGWACCWRGYLAKEKEGVAGRREQLRQAREARGGLDAAVGRLLGLVESGAIRPDDPAFRERLVEIGRASCRERV